MTTPNTDLAEQIARAMFNRARPGNEYADLTWVEVRGEYMDEAAAVLPIVEEHARAAAKAAWDECAQEQGGWPRPEGNPRALTYVLLANNPYMPKEETLDEH